MFATLPLICLVLLYTAFYISPATGKCFSEQPTGARDIMLRSIILSWTSIAVSVLLFNELMSVGRLISITTISVFWVSLICLTAIWLFFTAKKRRDLSGAENDIAISDYIKGILHDPILIVVVIVLICAFIYAIRTIPYDWDSMNYHLPRLAHWEQNGSIAHFICNDISQISDPYLAEFINLHIYVLSGHNDFLLNLLQTLSLATSTVFVYGIAKKIGCDKLFASLSALIFATSPIVFGESISTHVDMFSAMWLLFFVYLALDHTSMQVSLKVNRGSVVNLILIGVILGLSYAAKPTVVFAEVVFLLWITICCIKRKDRLSDYILTEVIVGIFAVIIILPEIVRNIIDFGSIAADEAGVAFLILTGDIRRYVVNFVENIIWNLNNIYIDISDATYRLLRRIAFILYGEDGGRSVISGYIPDVDARNMDNDMCINPLPVWLFVIALLTDMSDRVISRIRKRKEGTTRERSGYVTASFASYALFCLFVGWYAFVNRYECGYYALMIPASLFVIQKKIRDNTFIKGIATGIIMFICVVNLSDLLSYHKTYLYDGSNPWHSYFVLNWTYDEYEEAIEYVRKEDCKNIGLVTNSVTFEYPVWSMLDGEDVRIEHVCVENPTQKYRDAEFIPDVVLVIDRPIEDKYTVDGTAYGLVMDNGVVGVYSALPVR